jgi:hypothetical protein
VVLPRDWRVSVVPTPRTDPREGTSQARCDGLPFDDPVALAGPALVVSKPQQVEGPWWGRLGVASAVGVVRRTREARHLGLGWVQGQTVFPQPLWEHRQQTLRITLQGADHDDVIRIAVECRLSYEPWFHHPLEPDVEGHVEKHIGEDGRHSGALRYPRIRMRDASVFEDAGFKPFVNETTDDAIAYPLVQEVTEVLVIDGVKIVLDIDLVVPLSQKLFEPYLLQSVGIEACPVRNIERESWR